jgi:hypothetical protein
MQDARAQSTLEYIMSYGWAIIIVLIIVAALYELGAFSSTNLSSRVQPGACIVTRVNEYGTSAGPTLSGECQAGLPEDVMTSVNPIAGSYVSISGPGIESANQSFSVAFWVSTTYPNISQVVVAKEGGYGICFGGRGITISDSAGHYYTAPFRANLDQWYFVAVSYSNASGLAQIYINGSDVGSLLVPEFNQSQNSDTMYLSGTKSGRVCNTNVGLTGLLSNVQLYDDALPDSDVEALYLTGIGAAPVQLNYLTGWWPLNSNLNDYSSFNATGTIVGHGNGYTSFWTAGYSSP